MEREIGYSAVYVGAEQHRGPFAREQDMLRAKQAEAEKVAASRLDCSAVTQLPRTMATGAQRLISTADTMREMRGRLSRIVETIIGPYPVDPSPCADSAPPTDLVAGLHCQVDQIDEELRYIRCAVAALEGSVHG